MFKLSSKHYYLRHENEIQRFLSSNSNWIHIINRDNSFKNFTNTSENLFLIDLDSNLSKEIYKIEDQKFDLIVITDIFEVTDDIYELLNSLNKLLTNNGKILINSINTKWNFFLLFFEFFKIKKISRPRSYIHLKKIYSVSESSGFEIIRSYTRQIFPFRLLGIGNLLNNVLEIIFFKFNLGVNNYLLLSKTNKAPKEYSKTIIVPAKNEELNLEPIINRIPIFDSDYEILLVCAMSSDGTIETAYQMQQKYKNLPIKIIEQESKGKGPGVLEAIKVSNFEIITILDSDLSVDPERLQEFFEIVEQGRADFVNGTRLIYPMEDKAMRALNTYGNKIFQFLITLVIQQKLSDSLCGTKVFKKSNIIKILNWQKTLKTTDPFGDFDLIFSAAYAGDKILEYPVHYRARVYGETQISRFRDGFKLIKYFLESFYYFNISK